jgi:hypothetical protein
MRNDRDELVILRISMARIAQAIGADNSLNVTDLGYSGLHRLAATQDRGWNDLAGRIHEELEIRTGTDSHMRTVSDRAPEVAAKFVEILRREMTPDQFAEMCARNANVGPGICSNHDFRDANMDMAEAFYSLGLATCADMDLDANPELESAHFDACQLWNKAWELAMPMIGGRLFK